MSVNGSHTSFLQPALASSTGGVTSINQGWGFPREQPKFAQFPPFPEKKPQGLEVIELGPALDPSACKAQQKDGYAPASPASQAALGVTPACCVIVESLGISSSPFSPNFLICKLDVKKVPCAASGRHALHLAGTRCIWRARDA